MNKTKIDWVDYSWNPVVGCCHGCTYCWARRQNERFRYVEDFSDPQFTPSRLEEPGRVKKPSRIFVVSMGDLFCDLVPDNWIHQVIHSTERYMQHTFYFLTKNPQRYFRFEFPPHCHLGCTITSDQDEQRERLQYLYRYKLLHRAHPCFVSIEPLLGTVYLTWMLKKMDLVIVGAQTGPGATKPHPDWIESIRHHNIYYKENINPFLPVQNPKHHE